MCMSGGNVGEVQKETEEAFLGTVQNSENTNPWAITLLVNGKPVEFKIDTGADVTVIPRACLTAYHKLNWNEPRNSLVVQVT